MLNHSSAKCKSDVDASGDMEFDVACNLDSQDDLAVDGSRTDMPRRMSVCGWFSIQLDALATSEPWQGMYGN